MELKKYKLADITKIEISGVDKKTIEGEKPVRLCNFVDVYYNWAITKDKAKRFMIASAKQSEIDRFSIGKGMVAITKDSETKYDIGVATYIADNFDNVVLGYHCALITPNPTIVDGKYLNAFMHTQYIQKYFENNASGSGQRYTLSNDTISNIPVLLPPMGVQRTIGKLLADLDRKIELNRQINDNLEAMAKQLYDYWFVQFDFPNEEGKPYKSSGGAMVWNEKLKREIPSCFKVVNMGNLCDFRNGINYSKDETGNDYQIVNVRNISSSRILLDGEDFDVITVPTSKAENYVLKPDDIIIARSGCPGSTRLLLSPANTLFCGFIICCSPNDSSMRNYLVYCLKQLEGTNATTSGGSILQNVSQDTLKGLHVIVPEKQIIDKFNKTIELIFARMLNCLKESKALTQQRDELLPLLMNVQATVNDHLSALFLSSFILYRDQYNYMV